MNKLSSKLQVIGSSALLGVLLFSSVAVAATLPDQATSRREAAQTKLEDAKLRSCQAREKGIKNRSANLVRMAEKMQEKFDAIANRVKEYYVNTVVPSGVTVPDYDALVADIEAKKAAVQAALDEAEDAMDDFSCDSDDPKEAMAQFKEDMRGVKKALKDYRTSIKNLIVAVRTAMGGENNE